MNLQDILAPIEDFFLWTFSVLEAGGNNFNFLLIAIISLALVYWTFKLLGFKDEVPNR
ncbi:hypothetical protein OAL15_01940 [Flavobacteriales bacterium]|nr:hypothetical protein [Flavobacteriales bacterium]